MSKFLRRNRGLLAAALLGTSAAGALTFAVATAVPAYAAKYQFGPETEVRRLQPTSMRTQDDKPIDLGYRVTMHWFFLPYTVSTDGYTLIVPGQKNGIALDDSQISNLQKEGLLPAQMPSPSLGIADLVLGHLLWLFIGIMGLWRLAKAIGLRGRNEVLAHVPAVSSAQQQRALKPVAPSRPAPVPAPATRPIAPAQVRPQPTPPQRPSPAANPSSAPAQMRAPATAQPVQRRPETPAPAVRHETKAVAKAVEPAAVSPEPSTNLGVARIKCRVKALKAAA